MTASEIAQTFRAGVEDLLEATAFVRSTRLREELNRNASVEMQEWRHFGKPLLSKP